ASTATTELTDSHRISGARISALACQRAHTVRADSVTNFGLDAEIHANRERPGTPVTHNRAGTVPADEDRRAVVSGVDARVAEGQRRPFRAGRMAWVGEWRDCGEACPIVSLHMRQLACFPASPRARKPAPPPFDTGGAFRKERHANQKNSGCHRPIPGRME